MRWIMKPWGAAPGLACKGSPDLGLTRLPSQPSLAPAACSPALRRRHPNTLALSTDTGHRRDYGRDPRAGYRHDPAMWFRVSHRDDRYPPKKSVLGLELDAGFRAYPFSELGPAPASWVDRFQGR